MRTYNFDERLAFSKGTRQRTDLETIKSMIPGCTNVETANTEMDRQGIDYIATLRRGAAIFIDAKAREAGCSKFWNDGPELALEIWSVCPENGNGGKVGWTLDESKQTNLVLFTFDPSDTAQCYLLSFQLLRAAFHNNFHQWTGIYQRDKQSSIDWKSECVFVPANVVLDAIQDICIGTTEIAA